MCIANSAIIREPYQIPTLDEILHDFNNCTKFATLDLNQGYHQLELSRDSCDLTAFACHRGIFRYTRLIFGMSAAAEVYQRHIEQALGPFADDSSFIVNRRISLPKKNNSAFYVIIFILSNILCLCCTFNIFQEQDMKKMLIYTSILKSTSCGTTSKLE